MKTCSRCRQSLPFAEFHRNRRAADGLQFACIPCKREMAKTPHAKAWRARREFVGGALSAKECSTCRVLTPVAEFAVASRASDGLQTSCRACFAERARRRRADDTLRAADLAKRNQRYQDNAEAMRAAARERYWADPSRPALASRKTRLKKLYGMTLEQYDERVAAQGGRCAVCLVDCDKPHVDHDHVTGEVRGLLCSPCNTAIGLLQDNAAVMRRAVEYVEFWAVAQGQFTERT